MPQDDILPCVLLILPAGGNILNLNRMGEVSNLTNLKTFRLNAIGNFFGFSRLLKQVSFSQQLQTKEKVACALTEWFLKIVRFETLPCVGAAEGSLLIAI